MYPYALLLHILGATIWTGGHLVLACTVLPRAIRTRDLSYLENFEHGFEKIGIPALITQVVTGLYLAYQMLPDVGAWFDWSQTIPRIICIKLGLLLLTVILALDARLRLIPRLSHDNVTQLILHIIPVTILSVLFVVAGVGFRTNWFAW